MNIQKLGVSCLLLLPFSGINAQKGQLQRPNILMCIADDQSFPHAGAYGCKWVKTPAEELYRLTTDPECMKNLVPDGSLSEVKMQLINRMEQKLKEDKDPRILGDDTIFDSYPYSEELLRNFYNRFVAGEKLKAGWINATDIDQKIPE